MSQSFSAAPRGGWFQYHMHSPDALPSHTGFTGTTSCPLICFAWLPHCMPHCLHCSFAYLLNVMHILQSILAGLPPCPSACMPTCLLTYFPSTLVDALLPSPSGTALIISPSSSIISCTPSNILLRVQHKVNWLCLGCRLGRLPLWTLKSVKFSLLPFLNWKCIAGETMPNEGSAYICGHSMQREMAKARQLVGYCPQFDALAGTLTGTQKLPPQPCTAPS